MQDNFNTFSLIEEYLSGNLSSEEKIAFEQELASNPELQTLVDDYNLVDVLIEQNEILSINDKLTQIHKNTIKKNTIFKGLIGFAIVSLATLVYLLIPQNNIVNEKIEIGEENSKSIAFLVTEPTPFKIMDSMSEVELSTTIKQSKENVVVSKPIDSIISEPKKDEIIPKETKPLATKKTDSINEPVINNPIDSVKIKTDSTAKIKVRKPCKIALSPSDIAITSSCSEKSTGSIQFIKTNPDYLYSINDKVSYSSNPYFTSLREGNYTITLKSNAKQCESKSVELFIESYKCNYIIHPERFVYLEKSLDKFEDENSVEVFIFNRNGNLVFNKIIPTSEKFYWEGNSNTNTQTPMGNYTYLIKSGNRVSKGEITIIR